MRTNDDAVEKFLAGYNCAQAVLHASCGRLQFDKDLALRLTSGLGAGMGREGEVCGAVTGGIIAISVKYGRGEGEDKSKTEDAYAKTLEFISLFKERHGSVICRDLIKCDLRTAEGQKFFKDNDLLHGTCAKCVQTADDLVRAAIRA